MRRSVVTAVVMTVATTLIFLAVAITTSTAPAAASAVGSSGLRATCELQQRCGEHESGGQTCQDGCLPHHGLRSSVVALATAGKAAAPASLPRTWEINEGFAKRWRPPPRPAA